MSLKVFFSVVNGESIDIINFVAHEPCEHNMFNLFLFLKEYLLIVCLFVYFQQVCSFLLCCDIS